MLGKNRLYRGPAMVLALPLLVAPLVLSACSSGPSGYTDGGKALARAPKSTCQALTGVFSDGPDPDVDPVGYALSQIIPLESIHTSDGAVTATLSDLIKNDHTMVTTNGGDHGARSAIKKDDALLNQACPGVAP